MRFVCVSKGSEQLEVPARAQYIRTIMDELQRIDSHLLFYATMCMDMGGLTPFFYGFRDREMVLDIFEGTTGGRLIQNYNVIGGVMADLAPDFVEKVKKFIAYLPGVLKEYHAVFTGNVIAQQRLKGVGEPFEGGCDLLRCDGSHGPSFGVGLRCAQGTSLRRLRQGRIQRGDPYRRRLVRPLHGAYGGDPRVAGHHRKQLIDNIPEGDYAAKTKPIIRLPEGEYFASVEAPRGEFGAYIESRGDKYPYRMKFRSSCLPLVSVVDPLARGAKIGDLIAIGGSLDYAVPDVDRAYPSFHLDN